MTGEEGAVDVLDAQPQSLQQAHSGAVEEPSDKRVGAGEPVQHESNLGPRKHNWQTHGYFRLLDVVEARPLVDRQDLDVGGKAGLCRRRAGGLGEEAVARLRGRSLGRRRRRLDRPGWGPLELDGGASGGGDGARAGVNWINRLAIHPEFQLAGCG